MQVAGVQETVTVLAEVPVVRLKESDFEQSIRSETIDSIPLNGRQFVDLISLVPGVAARPPGEDQGAVREGFFTPSLGQEPFERVPLDKRYTNLLKIGAFGPLQDSGTPWLANPTFYSYVIPRGQVRSSGGITITGRGQPYIVYELLGIPVPDPANPPILTLSSIPTLTGGRLTPEAALAILNRFFPGPGYDQFVFLAETGSASINSGRPLNFVFQPPLIDQVGTIQRPVETAYTDSFNVGVEQALGAGFSIDAELFIRRSRKLLARRVINLLDSPRSANCNGNTTDGGPCIAELQYNGFLDTNALLVALKRRQAGRFSFLASYSFTDATDNFSTLRVPPSAGEQSTRDSDWISLRFLSGSDERQERQR